MINWEKIQDTLREWFANASGIPAYWFGEDVENAHTPYCELQVSSSVGLGIDETRREYDASLPTGKELVTTQCGNRLFVLSCRAKTRDQRPNYAARFYLEKIRTAIRKPSSLAIFGAANLALVGAEGLVNLDYVFQDRQQSEALLDIRFATTANETDEKESAGYIAQTEISSDLKDAGGTSLPASLQFNDERIPE